MQDERGALRRMQEKLYSRVLPTGIRKRPAPSEESITKGNVWKADEEATAPARLSTSVDPMTPAKPFSLLPLLLGALVFFVIATGIAAYTFFYGGNTVSSDNIRMAILGPSLVDGGKEVPLQITIENNNTAALELVDLVVEYPEGTRRSDDTTESLPRERISLGTIAPGESVKQTVHPVLFGEEGRSLRILATLEYRVSGSNAVFVKEETLDLMLGASPVSILVEGPDEMVAGQEFAFLVEIRSNAQTNVEHVALEAQYPFGFSVTGTDPETAVGEGVWQLGTLKPGETKEVHVRGVLDGQNDEERVFRFLVGAEEDMTAAHVRVPYLTVPHTLTLKRPFVGATLALNGDESKTVVVSPGSTVRGVITWTNNLDTEMQDLVIEAKLSGQALDRGSVIASRGFYRSIDSTIVWSRDDDDALATVAPGAQGTVDFTFTPRSSQDGAALTNPEIGISVSVAAKRTESGSAPESISSVFTKAVRVGSAMSFATRARHFAGPIQNRGPMPPKVEQETTYTAVWTLRNPSNTIAGAKAIATLPSYVKYLGGSTPQGEALSFDERSRTVTWALGEVKAGAGFGMAAREVSFQVALTPSLSQLGTAPQLVGRVSITGEDRFTGGRISIDGEPITTLITGGESGYTSAMDKVVE